MNFIARFIPCLRPQTESDLPPDAPRISELDHGIISDVMDRLSPNERRNLGLANRALNEVLRARMSRAEVTGDQLGHAIERFPFLKQIHLPVITEPGQLRPLKDARHLRELVIRSGHALNREDLQAIGSVSTLTHLTLRMTELSLPDDWAPLSQLTHLRSLDLSANRSLPDHALAHLAQLDQLASLDIRGCTELNSAAFTHLGRLTGLRQVSAGDCSGLDDAAIASLAHIANLSTLNIVRSSAINGSGFRAFSSHKNLQELTLSGHTTHHDQTLNHLGAITTLKRLVINDSFQLSGVGLASWQALTALEALDLERCFAFSDDGLAHLARLPRLKSINLSCTGVTAEGFAHFPEDAPLKSLRLPHTPLNDAGLAALSRLKNIEELDIAHSSRITDNGIAAINRMPSVRTLSLEGIFRLSERAAMLLPQKFPHVSTLSASALAANPALAGLFPHLRSLTIERHAMSDQTLYELARNTDLQTLSLQGCVGFTAQGLSHLARLPHLEKLELNLDYSGRDGDAPLQGLADCHSLRQLNLTGWLLTKASQAVLTELKTRGCQIVISPPLPPTWALPQRK